MRYNTQRKGNKFDLLFYWLILSLSLLLIGFEVTYGEPINKKRWSVSFAFLTSGITGTFLCLIFMIVDIWNNRIVKDYLSQPLLWLGMNPLFIYIGMMSFQNILIHNIHFTYKGEETNVWEFIDAHLLDSWIN